MDKTKYSIIDANEYGVVSYYLKVDDTSVLPQKGIESSSTAQYFNLTTGELKVYYFVENNNALEDGTWKAMV